MQRKELKKTGIKVSKLCFGSLVMGPLQSNLLSEEGASLIRYGYEKDLDFLDSAELYETYPHINKTLKNIDRSDYIIASKCYAHSGEMAEERFEKVLKGLETDYLDIFMLHEQISGEVIEASLSGLIEKCYH